MRRTIRFFVVLILIAPCAFCDDGTTPDMFGTWSRGSAEPYPWLKGAFVGFQWADIEPAPGAFDWNRFDRDVGEIARAGKYVQLIVFTGPGAPRWLFDNGVPEVETTPTLNPWGEPHGGWNHYWTYPFYLDPDYEVYWHRMLRNVAAHIDELPSDVRKMIICIQTAEGTTGDEGGYKGDPLDSEYELPEKEWRALKFRAWLLYKELFTTKDPPIHVLINSGNQGQYNDWILENMPDTWRKAGNPGHGYQLNDELEMMEFLDPLINHRNRNGNFIRCRSEMDETHKGWFKEAPAWNMYWLHLWVLHFGMDILQHGSGSLDNPVFHPAFIFMSKYAGRKDPATSPGAWCALRDGLDAADYERFPVEKFGPGEFHTKNRKESIQRCLNIVKAFEAYGAKQGDPEKAMYTTMQNRNAKSMNDVGWNIEAGNYQRYLTQIDPNGTSQGYWRVGPKDQIFGRFARGFDSANGKNAMYFDLDDQFFAKSAQEDTRSVSIRVVYFDQGNGSWELRYDAEENPEKNLLSVTNNDTGRWKESTVEVDDAQFQNRGPKGADLVLAHTSGADTLFHMIEIERR